MANTLITYEVRGIKRQVVAKFNIGDIVFVTTDPNQYKRLIVAWQIDDTSVMYKLSLDGVNTIHYGTEISKVKEDPEEWWKNSKDEDSDDDNSVEDTPKGKK